MSLSVSQITIKNEPFSFEKSDTKHTIAKGIKCGEVLFLPQAELWFVCSICEESFHNVLVFRNHILGEHFIGPESTTIDPSDWNQNDASDCNQNDPLDWNKDIAIKLDDIEDDVVDINATKTTSEIEQCIDNEGHNHEQPQIKTDESEHENLTSFPESAPLPSMPNIKKKRKKKVYACHMCPHTCSSKSLLEAHFLVAHSTGDRCYQCEECGKCFAYSASLRTHLIVHSGIRPFKCEFCDATFAHATSLKTHRFTHTGERPYKCTMCEEGFGNPGGLKRHMIEHTGESPYVCQYCGKKFFNNSHYQRHIISHSDRKTFDCKVCGKVFKHNETLKRHMASDEHTGERTHVCDVCPKRFSSKKNLVQHQKLHSATKAYTCKVCKKSFAQNAGLYSHMKSHQNKD